MTSSNLVGCSTGRSAGFAPLRILSTEVRGSPVHIVQTRAIGHDETSVHPLGPRTHRWQTALCRELGDGRSVSIEHGAPIDENRAHVLSDHRRDGAAYVAGGPHSHRLKLQPQSWRSGFCFLHHSPSSRLCWV